MNLCPIYWLSDVNKHTDNFTFILPYVTLHYYWYFKNRHVEFKILVADVCVLELDAKILLEVPRRSEELIVLVFSAEQ
jgi:hypothetical protein